MWLTHFLVLLPAPVPSSLALLSGAEGRLMLCGSVWRGVC
jgi:hypothetical protein